MPTDTTYGVIGSALSPETVDNVYKIRHRSTHKPLIILISSIDDLKIFGITLNQKTFQRLSRLWPNPVSIILPVPDPKWEYLHRGTKSLAFRLPKDRALREFLVQTGPLVAPSANPENLPTSKTIQESYDYFGDRVSFYIDGGQMALLPSTLVKIDNGKITVIREGAFKIKSSPSKFLSL